MHILVNGQLIHTESTTLAALLNEQQFDAGAVACALNGDFIPRDRYSTTSLGEGNRIEVLSPMQGG